MADRLQSALPGLVDWIERTRAPGGYGGPVVHWWRDCLVDCRPAHDWRYEGIVLAYLDLHRTTREEGWLARAQRAGDDLVQALRTDGHFAQSQFEQNPGVGGTPHEAAADIALLALARASTGAARERYLGAARQNLEKAHVDRLWDADARAFRDHPARRAFVPNKLCTIVEALLALADLSGDERFALEYALPTGEMVLRQQVRKPGSPLDGAIAQVSDSPPSGARYFPYYVARCIPGLLAAHQCFGDERFADAALAAGRFVASSREPDGGFPQIVYQDGAVQRYPRWIAGAGDVLRALELLRPLGLDFDAAPTREWIARGILPTGAPASAHGFAGQASGRLTSELLDLRDYIPVAGWADKLLRFLAGEIAAGAGTPGGGTDARVFEAECGFKGRRVSLRLEAADITVTERGEPVYVWRAGKPFPEVLASWFVGR